MTQHPEQSADQCLKVSLVTSLLITNHFVLDFNEVLYISACLMCCRTV